MSYGASALATSTTPQVFTHPGRPHLLTDLQADLLPALPWCLVWNTREDRGNWLTGSSAGTSPFSWLLVWEQYFLKIVYQPHVAWGSPGSPWKAPGDVVGWKPFPVCYGWPKKICFGFFFRSHWWSQWCFIQPFSFSMLLNQNQEVPHCVPKATLLLPLLMWSNAEIP